MRHATLTCLFGLAGCAMRLLVVPLVILALGGCASRYQELSAGGGVTAAKMTEDVYRVSARGNALTEPTRIQDFVLLKAAETTLAAGRTHFVIIGLSEVGTARNGRQTGLYAFGGAAGPDGGRLMSDMTGANRHSIDGLSGEDVMIRLLKPDASADDKAKALDARQLAENIGPRLKRPQGAPPPEGGAPAGT